MTEEQNLEINKWSQFISENVKGVKTRTALSHYVKKLVLNDTIVIINFYHLAMLLGIKTSILAKIIANPDSFYYNFEIPKRSGGFRKISAPYPVLLQAQKWIYNNILSHIKINEHAKGFVKSTSIVKNAEVHIGYNYLLKMDIENFFPSIKKNRVLSIFQNLGYTTKISYYLASLCCMNDSLPQGAVTSPCISNIISKRMDARISGLSKRFNLNYSRYADDFTISGNRFPVRIIDYISSIINQEGFTVNKKKTKLISKGKQKIITGISISSGTLKLPKKNKREVRQCIHYITTRGLFEHQKHINSNDPIYIERMLGYLYFWLSIEPENHFVISSIKKLKDYNQSPISPNE